jgi:hypothetical protein
MSNSQEYYSYRGGQKINLVKRRDQIIVRSLPDRLKDIGITDAEQVSSSSSRVTTRSLDLERLMSEARHVATTHHAYQIADFCKRSIVEWGRNRRGEGGGTRVGNAHLPVEILFIATDESQLGHS